MYADTLALYDFSGLESRPVELFKDRKCTVPLDGYVELRVTGRERVDEQESGMVLEFECPICRARAYSEWDAKMGLHFEKDYEHLSDLFQMEQRPGIVFVKSSFAQTIVDLNLRPFTLTRFEDIEPYERRHRRKSGNHKERNA